MAIMQCPECTYPMRYVYLDEHHRFRMCTNRNCGHQGKITKIKTEWEKAKAKDGIRY